MTDRIGFIGLGAMGKGMASNLQNKGFQLSVFDIDPQPMAVLVQLGAKQSASIAELTEASDIVVTMLPGSPEVDAVVLGEGQQAGEAEIRVFAGARLADFKVPRKILFLDEIPKGAAGKPRPIGLAEKLGLT